MALYQLSGIDYKISIEAVKCLNTKAKTTEIYTHVSTKSLQNIKSPFDDLDIDQLNSIFNDKERMNNVPQYIRILLAWGCFVILIHKLVATLDDSGINKKVLTKRNTNEKI